MTEVVEEKNETIETAIKPEKKFTWTKDRIILAIIFIIILLVAIALLIVVIVDRTFLFTVVRDYFIRPIIYLPVAARVAIFLGIMILQSIIATIPSELILLSGGMIFGLGWGTLIGVVGSMLSATITFYIAKRGGRSIVDAASEKVGIIKRTIYIFDQWIRKWGIWAIIIGRAVPVIMFDPISYAAGIVNVKDRHYFIATFIGSIPRSVFYSVLGVQLLGNNPIEYILTLTPEQVNALADQFNYIFFAIFGILVFMFVLSNIIYYVVERKKKKKLIQQHLEGTEKTETETAKEKNNKIEQNEEIK